MNPIILETFLKYLTRHLYDAIIKKLKYMEEKKYWLVGLFSLVDLSIYVK